MFDPVTQPFVYKWIHKPTGKWYIGSRTARGCHINDGYICSSKSVKPMIERKPEEWERYILAIGFADEMRKLETKLLLESNAKRNPMSFNRNNADGRHGIRKFGQTLKPTKNQFLKALDKELGKPFLQCVAEHYIKALTDKDKAGIIFYERLFKSKKMTIKFNGEVLYDGKLE